MFLLCSSLGKCCVSPLLLRGAAWFPSFWVVLLFFLLFCRVVLLGLILPFGWYCCFSFSCLVVLSSFSSFGKWCVSPVFCQVVLLGLLLPFGWCCCFSFSWLVVLSSFSSFGWSCFFQCLLSGGAAWSPPSFWVVLLFFRSLLLGGAAWFSSILWEVWCCSFFFLCLVVLPSFSSFGKWCVSPHLLSIVNLFPKRCMAFAWVRGCIRLTDAFVEIILVHVCCFSDAQILHNSILRVLTSSVFVQKMLVDTQEMDPLALLHFGRFSDSIAPFVLPTNPLELEQIASSELCLDIRCQVLLTCAALSASVHPIPPLQRICHFHVNQEPDRTRALSFCMTCTLTSSHHGVCRRSVERSSTCVHLSWKLWLFALDTVNTTMALHASQCRVLLLKTIRNRSAWR